MSTPVIPPTVLENSAPIVNPTSQSPPYMSFIFLMILFIGLFFKEIMVKLIFVGIGFIWSTRASVVFMTRVIKEERRLLAVYPVFFFYTFIAWLILLQ